MTKSTDTKIFIGSLVAIAGGVGLLVAGLFVAYVNGAFIMRGPDVVGIHPSAFSWSMAGLAVVGILAVIGGALAQFVAWIGAVSDPPDILPHARSLAFGEVGASGTAPLPNRRRARYRRTRDHLNE